MQPQGTEGYQDCFEQHVKRMKDFRMSHACLKNLEDSGATEAHAEELSRLLPALQKFGYVLNLICERGMVLLPRNWQN